MEKKIVVTDKAPKAIGPYSVAVKAGQFVFCSGQGGLDPVTGSVVEGGVEAETRQCFKNLQAVLEAAGSDLKKAVKTTVYLRDMNDFTKMNAVYAEVFAGSSYPARTTIQAAALPRNIAVEIEVIALIE